MKRSDISDRDVLEAYAKFRCGEKNCWPHEILVKDLGAPEKVAYRACERAHDRGYISYGVSLRSGWLTDKGKALLAEECAVS